MYTIKKNGTKYLIVEQATNNVVKVYFNERDAKKTHNILNNGSGFRGNTPNFFLDKKIKKHK